MRISQWEVINMNKILRYVSVFIFILTLVLSVSCSVFSAKPNVSQETVRGTLEETSTESVLESASTTTEGQSTQETTSDYPKPINYVSDFAEMIDPENETKINNLAADLEKKTTAQVFVVTVDSLEGKTIEKYAFELFNEWGIGQKDKNNGVLLLIASQEKKVRIEVGLGLESVITNEIAQKIIDEIIVPRFRNSKYGLGSYECVEKISELIISASE
jgi:hypothetical protein